MSMYILNTNYHTSSKICICELSMSVLTLDWSTRHMTLSIYRSLQCTYTCTCTSTHCTLQHAITRKLDYVKILQAKYFTGKNISIYGIIFVIRT